MAFFGFSDTDCFAAPDFTNYLKNFRPKAEQDEIDREQNERIAKLEQGGAGGVGTDGGYYSPNVDNDGNLTWTASADNMPAVTGANIKGPQGNKGETGATGAQGPAGADGSPGADGYTPVRGVDYWTDEDKQQIVDDVLNALPDGDGVSY